MADGREPNQNYLSFLLQLITSLPLYARAIIVLVALLSLGVYGYYKLLGGKPTPAGVTVNVNPNSLTGNLPAVVQVTEGASPYTNGVPYAPEGASKAPNPEAEEDLAAYKYHFASEEKPEEGTILGIDKDHYIHYKLFSIDRCLWINRHWDGVDNEQWLRDPAYHLHDAHLQKSAEAKPAFEANAVSTPAALTDLSRPDLILASVDARTFHGLDLITNLLPIQGDCINPHPGQFRFWWGAPIDACKTPMFRRFADGCTHYQIYNNCANAWDGRIFWTYCRKISQHY